MRRLSFVFVLLSIILVTNAAYAQEAFLIDGTKWLALDKPSKVFYLAGYLKGAYRGILVGLRDIDCINHQEIADLGKSKYRDFVGKGNLQALLDEIDNVYRDKKNLAIEADQVIVFGLTKIKGNMSKQKQEVWLDLLRTMNQ
ncbi:MAG TPA: hypothetical protein VMW89_19635 [Desulfatiglandales bacterium]|nr:hypothetical protein [Desulfatiglandales bacterium]